MWIFALPTEAEWEKAARGPDNFDYALGMSISDNEVGLYNWRKNPGADVTVVGLAETKSKYQPNRYGVYHLTGNVSEWTQSIYRAYSRQHPYIDDDDRITTRCRENASCVVVPGTRRVLPCFTFLIARIFVRRWKLLTWVFGWLHAQFRNIRSYDAQQQETLLS